MRVFIRIDIREKDKMKTKRKNKNQIVRNGIKKSVVRCTGGETTAQETIEWDPPIWTGMQFAIVPGGRRPRRGVHISLECGGGGGPRVVLQYTETHVGSPSFVNRGVKNVYFIYTPPGFIG